MKVLFATTNPAKIKKYAEKLKENKNTREGILGRDYEIALGNDNKTYIKKVNEQMSLLELEDGQDE